MITLPCRHLGNLNGPAVLHWSISPVSVANLSSSPVMVVIFGAALILPPGHSPDNPCGGVASDESGAPSDRRGIPRCR